jgi:hypothetical protein
VPSRTPFAEVAFPTGVRLFSEPVAIRPWAPVSLKDIDIQIERGTLSIKGARKFERVEGKGTGYHRIERSYGEFQRFFRPAGHGGYREGEGRLP